MSAIVARYRPAVKSVARQPQEFAQPRSALSRQTVSGMSYLLHKITVPSSDSLNSGHGLRDNPLEKSDKVTDLCRGQILKVTRRYAQRDQICAHVEIRATHLRLEGLNKVLSLWSLHGNQYIADQALQLLRVERLQRCPWRLTSRLYVLCHFLLPLKDGFPMQLEVRAVA